MIVIERMPALLRGKAQHEAGITVDIDRLDGGPSEWQQLSVMNLLSRK